MALRSAFSMKVSNSRKIVSTPESPSPCVIIIRDVNIVDHKNLLTVSGSVILKQNGHVELSSEKEVRKQFRIILDGIEYAGEPLIVSGFISYPQVLVW